MGKSLTKSRTFWVNAIITVAAVIGALVNLDWVAANPTLAGLFPAAQGIVNIFLRLVTEKPIK